MNGDGLLDLVVGSFDSHDVQVLLADAQGGLSPHGQTIAREGVWMIVTGDVNGDGHADVVTANAGDNSVSVLIGNGTGDLILSRTYASGFFPLAVDLGDLDGDGDLDMVSSNFGSELASEPGSWRVFENQGGGIFESAARLTTNGAGSCAVLHDRDNNGTLDMTTIDELDDLLVLFTNRPLATSAESSDSPGDGSGDGLGDEREISLFPNPFRDGVTIDVADSSPASISVDIYDVTGRHIRMLDGSVTGRIKTRLHWDGLNRFGHSVPPGPYVIRVRRGGSTISILLIRSGE